MDGLGVELGRSVVLRLGVSVGCDDNVDDMVGMMQLFLSPFLLMVGELICLLKMDEGSAGLDVF
jgi:hypothetical protein